MKGSVGVLVPSVTMKEGMSMGILLAENDRVIADGLGRSLRKSGYAVDWVANGADAEEAYLDGFHQILSKKCL